MKKLNVLNVIKVKLQNNFDYNIFFKEIKFCIDAYKLGIICDICERTFKLKDSYYCKPPCDFSFCNSCYESKYFFPMDLTLN